MESRRLLECLESDFSRFRSAIAGVDLAAPVPSCPDWTVADLVRHVAAVYLHKVECMRLGTRPEPWPPAGLNEEEPRALLDRAYAALRAEFAVRSPGSPAWTWFPPDQTVGFWMRRMAQETLIHRVDAELSAGEAIGPMPDDLANDGIDELLVAMVEFNTRSWPEEFAEMLQGATGDVIRLSTPRSTWWIRTTPALVEVGAGECGAYKVAADVRGEPADLLLWLWNRAGEHAVHSSGDPVELQRLRRIMVASTA